MANTCEAPREVKRAYATKLAPQLVQRHGKKKRYTPQEILDAAIDAGLNVDFVCWGYVLFLDEATFDQMHEHTGEACDYAEMHTEMGQHLAEAFQGTDSWAGSFDWSVFDPTAWDWPELSEWFDIDIFDIS